MAVQVGGACYDDAAAAARAACDRIGYQVVPVSGGAASVECVGSGAMPGVPSNSPYVTTRVGSKVGTGAWTYSSNTTQSLTAPACSVLTWQDGLSLGWSIVGVWVVVVAARMVASAGRVEGRES